jgi:hypothetical protein
MFEQERSEGSEGTYVLPGGSYFRGGTCGSVRTTSTVVVLKSCRDKVGFVHIMVQNKVAVLTLVCVIQSVLYSNVHRCTYAILCIVIVVLLLVQLRGPEYKYSRPDPDRIKKCRTFAIRS